MIALRLLCALTLLILAACSSTPERLGAPIEGYSHTSAAINRFSVNGSGGSNIGPHSGGGQTCCASLPIKWQPGLKVVVEWEKDPDPRVSLPPLGTDVYREAYKKHAAKYTRHRAVVEVAPYDDLGVVTVHFLPCNQVKVAAGTTRPHMPSHPYHYPLNMEEPSQC